MALTADNDIGGAIVRRYFNNNTMRPGDRLTREQVLALRNRQALIRTEHIKVFPPGDSASTEASERHVAHIGGGRFNVIAGRKINDEPLSRAEADVLAGQRSN